MLPRRLTLLPTALAVVAMLTTLPSAGAEPATPAAADWPHWRGPTGDNKSALTGIRKDWAGGLTKLWDADNLCLPPAAGKEDDRNFCPGAPSVAGGTLVVQGRADANDVLLALDAAKGTPLWRKECRAPLDRLEGTTVGAGPRAQPWVDGSTAITFGASGVLACWDLATGRQQWQRDLRADHKMAVPYWGFCSCPVVVADKVLVSLGGYGQGPGDPLLVAVEKATGKTAWTAGKGPGAWASLSVQPVDGTPQLIAFPTRGVVGMDPASGAELWSIPWKTAYSCNVPTPVVDGTTLFVTSGYNTGCQAFDIRGGQVKPLWDKTKAIVSCCSDPVIVGGFVYGFSGQGKGGKLVCLDLKTGQEKWSTVELGNGSLVWVDGCLLCLTYAGKLALVEASPDGYKKLAAMDVVKVVQVPSYTIPVVAGGNVYVRYGAKLACYRLAK